MRAWKIREMHTVIVNLKEGDNLEELGIDGEHNIKLDLKRNRVGRRELDGSGYGGTVGDKL